ncbi:MAG: hypothetical protein Q8M94_07075 [Ignavibacteria bacterium]|nr:hypothetical protein [Ignavibacteria bacterium]
MMTKRFLKFILLFLVPLVLLSACNHVRDENQDEESLTNEIKNATLSNFIGFYFVGKHSGVPSIFRYDYGKDKFNVFWHSIDERVIDLLISPDYKSGFFITKRKQRLKSSQPAIEKGKLYRIDFEANKVESITQLEEGIQVIPFWTDNDRFTLIINSIDKTIASYVNKNTQVYNRFGKLLSDNTEIFDLTKDGYPVTKYPSLNFESHNNLFAVIEKNDSVRIMQLNSKKEINTRFTAKKLLQIGWADNNKNLVMLMIPKSELPAESNDYQKSVLAVFDLQMKKTVKMFDAAGFKRFVLIGDFLIFDNGIGSDLNIELFNLSSLKNYKTIKLTGGCSLRNISG